MRLLHTSDWHLGRMLHGLRLLGEQAQALDRIVEITATEHIDVVVIAGDVYDRAVPPSEAVALFGELLVRLRALGTHVVAIAGNHDAATRLCAGGRLLEHAGVTIRGPVERIHEPVVLADDHGPVAVYPVPFLDPLVASTALLGDEDDGQALRALRLSQHQVMARAMARVRADHDRRGRPRSVVVAHALVAGAIGSDSERDLAVGDVELTGAHAFSGVDYVALGHLHRPQLVGGDQGLAYAGSPLPYSFSEQDDAKSVRLVELGPDGLLGCETVPLGVGTPLRTVRGELDDLLRDPRHAGAEHAHVRVELTDPTLPRQAKARLEERFRRVLQLRHVPPAALGPGPAPAAGHVRGVAPLELTQQFARDHLGTLTERQHRVLAEAVAAVAGEVTP